MKLENTVKRWSLKAILIAAGFSIVVLLLMIFQGIFRYKIFSKNDPEILAYILLGCGVLIAVLAVINIVSNLNIISEKMSGDEKKKSKAVNKKALFYWIVASLAFVIGLALTLHFVNLSNTRRSANRILAEMDGLMKSDAPLIDRIASDIEGESNLRDISMMLTILDQNALTIDDLEILFPKEIQGTLTFLYIDRWNRGAGTYNYSPISDSVFMTSNPAEMHYLQSLFSSNTNRNPAPLYFTKRPFITVYYPVVRDGRVVFVFYSSYNSIQGSFNKYQNF